MSHALFGLTLLAGGAFVAVAGYRARVTDIEMPPAGLVIRYARRPAFTLMWSDFRSLRPPIIPLSGWRIEGAGLSTTLMPSDLWGHEWVLDAIIGAAGLRFDGGAWRGGWRRPS
jgi:hypothetical protein